MKQRLLIILVFILITAMVMSGCSSAGEASSANSDKKVVVNVGVQSTGLMLLIREKGWLDEAYKEVGAEVKWSDFPSGPPHFEAMASDRLDFGAVGNGPVITAQAGKIDFKEFAILSPGNRGDGILVHADSEIKAITDLKGKKIGVAKGSSAYTFVYRAAVNVGLKPEELNLIQLQPDEAQAAFDSKAIDAWAIWEPYVSVNTDKGAVVLANGESENLTSPSFGIVRTKFVQQHPELVEIFVGVYAKALAWARENPEEAVQVIADKKNIEPELMKVVFEKADHTLEPITQEYIDGQQYTADLLYQTGGIKEKVDVSKVVDNSFIEKLLDSQK